MTCKKQGTKNAKKGSGVEFQKVLHSVNHVSNKDQMTSLNMGLSKHRKRKANGLTESIKGKGSSSGLHQEKLITNQLIKPNRGPKGKTGTSHTRAFTPTKHVKGSTASSSLQLTIATPRTSFRTFLPPSNEPANGQFTFSNEAQWEMGDTSGEQSHRNSKNSDRKNQMVQSHSSQRVEIHIPTDEVQCKNREEVIIRPSLASHESAMVGFQIGHPRKDRDQSSRMEEFVTAISNANLM